MGFYFYLQNSSRQSFCYPFCSKFLLGWICPTTKSAKQNFIYWALPRSLERNLTSIISHKKKIGLIFFYTLKVSSADWSPTILMCDSNNCAICMWYNVIYCIYFLFWTISLYYCTSIWIFICFFLKESSLELIFLQQTFKKSCYNFNDIFLLNYYMFF